MRGRALTDGDIHRVRAALVAEATALLEAEGRDAVSLRQVAARAGMSRSTPYTYFADKDALLDAVRAAAIDALTAAAEAALAQQSTVEARLAALGAAYVGFALSRPALYALIFESPGGQPTSPSDAPEEVQAAAARYRALAQIPLREAEERGLLTVAPERLSDVLWASTHGVIQLHRAGKLRRPLHEVLKDMGDILAFGFARHKEAT